MRKFASIFLPLLIFLFSSEPVSAHAFGTTYNLPIPFSLYSYAAAGVLLVSFLVIGFFIKENTAFATIQRINISKNPLVAVLSSKTSQKIYKGISLFLFFFTILSGLIGEDLSAYNFNMTFFWVIFVLGLTYVTFFLGNIWDVINPWKIMVEFAEKMKGSPIEGTLRYSKKASYYPAFILYLLFIIIELFTGTTPFSLSIILIQYTVITLFAVFLFGKDTWFQYGEFFSVFFRLISYTAPLTKEREKIFLRLPFSGLLEQKTTAISLLLFILFMLSSTAFDGFRETNVWATIYWQSVGRGLGSVSHQIVELVGLLLSPFLFLGLYLLAIFVMKKLVMTERSVFSLALAFTFSLLPIALVYNIAHYFTLLLIQGQDIIRFLSDPFGWNWNLFGTGTFSPNAGIINAATVWHTQVVLILLGHIISVLIAHLIAVKLFPHHKGALKSQVPMLLLMIAYTIIGLWILSQPLSVG